MRTLIRCAIVACATFFSCDTLFAQSANERFRHDLDSLFSDTTFSNATFGVAIQSLKTGEYLYRKNETKSLMPASNLKLFTTAEALALLGPEYRYKTELLTNGKIKGDTSYAMGLTLYGDLIIRGSGDPTFGDIALDTAGSYGDVDTTLSGWFINPIEAFTGIIEEAFGKIKGSIVGDDSYFSDEVYPLGWNVEDLPYYYAPEVTALSYQGDQATVIVKPGKHSGSRAIAELDLDTDFVKGAILDNSAVTVDSAHSNHIVISRKIGTDTIEIRGSISLTNAADTQQVSIENPTLLAPRALFRFLKHEEYKIPGGIKNRGDSAFTSGEFDSLYSISSPALSLIVRHMNKTSDNLYAECLFRTVAKVIGGEGSWTRGIEVMRKYLATIGIDTARLQFTDGSGLSRMDLVTANDIVTVLRAMASNPKLDSAFYNSLPIMGVDGTLQNQMKGTPAQGNIHAKTGSMTGVRAISGYLTTRDGEMLAFSILANNYTNPGSEIGKLEDEVLLKLVNFSRK